jgi:hypothetical protein
MTPAGQDPLLHVAGAEVLLPADEGRGSQRVELEISGKGARPGKTPESGMVLETLS